jgi:hypothetical protein
VIWLGLAAAIIFFMTTGAVAYWNFQILRADSALVVRSGDTLTALEDVLSTVNDAKPASAAICSPVRTATSIPTMLRYGKLDRASTLYSD